MSKENEKSIKRYLSGYAFNLNLEVEEKEIKRLARNHCVIWRHGDDEAYPCLVTWETAKTFPNATFDVATSEEEDEIESAKSEFERLVLVTKLEIKHKVKEV